MIPDPSAPPPADPTTLPEWAVNLGLQPHPEGGWYAETWRSPTTLPGETLGGYPGPRSLGTAIHFLLLPGETSAWHRVRSAELWFLHRGRLELSLGGDGASPSTPLTAAHGGGDDLPERCVLGLDIVAGERPQLLVPPNHWQAARTLDDEACLVSCVVVPGFDFADFTLASPKG